MSDRFVIIGACFPMVLGAVALVVGQRTPPERVASAATHVRPDAGVNAPSGDLAAIKPAWVGVVIAGYTADLTADAVGRIASVTAQTGQHVGANEPLLEFDRGDVNTAVGAADAEYGQRQSDVARADARLEAAKSRLERLTAGEKWLSKQEIDTARAEARVAQAELYAAHSGVAMGRARLNQQKLRESRHTLVAPFAGTVVISDVAPGDNVAAGQVLARVFSEDRKVRFALPRGDLPQSGAMEVLVHLAGKPDSIHANVSAFRPEIDPSTDLVFATATSPDGVMTSTSWIPGTPVEITRVDGSP